ncbi:MAG: Fic family protein [Neisseriaceae bacterium]|nr:Fic family protein [Neisseriaceae bacterium]
MKYNPEFVAYRPILSEEEKSQLFELSKYYLLDTFKKDQRNYEEAMVDFVYTSAKIEGNTYSRLDTDNLLRLGYTAGGKLYSDAIMLMNLRNAFYSVIENDKNTVFDADYVANLHKTLMKDLLPAFEQGIVRTSGVLIGGTEYSPLAEPERLKTEQKFILQTANQYDNAFEQAIYLHCNTAYLQYFRDGNKRTARLLQTASMAKHQVLPLFFSDKLITEYTQAVVHYYETGEYEPYIAFFKENYRINMERFTGQEISLEISKDIDEPEIDR